MSPPSEVALSPRVDNTAQIRRGNFSFDIDSKYSVQHHDFNHLESGHDDHHLLDELDSYVSGGVLTEFEPNQLIVALKDTSVLPTLLRKFNAKVVRQSEVVGMPRFEGDKLTGEFKVIPASFSKISLPVYTIALAPSADFHDAELLELGSTSGLDEHIKFSSRKSASLFLNLLRIQQNFKTSIDYVCLNTVYHPDSTQEAATLDAPGSDFWWVAPNENGYQGANLVEFGQAGDAIWNYGRGGKGITVAVVDSNFRTQSGWNPDNEDPHYRAKGWISPTIVQGWETTFNVLTRSEDIGIDPNWTTSPFHGQAVSSLIFAPHDDRDGTLGVAPRATPMLIQTPQREEFVADAVSHAAHNGAKIINISWSFPSHTADPNSPLFIIEHAKSYFAIKNAAESGVIVVCSAGNQGDTTARFPADSPHVISVGALNKTGSRAKWSSTEESHSNFVDIWAPGTDILVPPDPDPDSYKKDSGTSYAAPLVSGVLAILASQGLVNDVQSARDYLRAFGYQFPAYSAAPALNGLNCVRRGVNNGPFPLPSDSPDGKLASPSPSPSTSIGDVPSPEPTVITVPVNGDLFCQQNPSACYPVP